MEERCTQFAGHCPGKHGFPISRRAEEEQATASLDSKDWVFSRMCG
jgi:hypothetical protein